MALTRDGIKRRIEKIEQRQQAMVGEAIARIQQRTGWSLEAISAEVARLVAYHREHGAWPAEISEALRTPPTTQIVLRWPDSTDEDVECSSRQGILIVSQPLLSPAFLGNQVDSLTGVGGTPKACIPRLRMTTSSRQDDSVKHFEPRDGLYFANEYSDAVSPRT
jgi:hypothetical protein